MLKQPIICWAIATTKSERDWSYDELFDTVEEAIAASNIGGGDVLRAGARGAYLFSKPLMR